MTGHFPPTTLALSFNDLVFYGFVFLFVVVPWIAKTLKKAGDKANPNRTRPQKSSQTIRQSTTDRRRQLEELARQRREAISSRSAQPSPSAATNLTMAQRAERARAQATYQQRAQQLRQQALPPSPPPQGDLAAATIPSKKPVHLQKRRETQIRQQRLTEYDQTDVHRHTSGPIGPAGPVKRSTLGRLDARKLRHAILLKEILDPPVALRSPSTESAGNGI